MQLPKMDIMTIVKDWFGLIAVLIAAVTAAGFTLSTPWPARAEVEAVQKQVSDLQKQLKNESCLVLKLLYKTYEDDKKTAEKDLEQNPNSVSAKKAKEDAEEAVKDIRDQIRASCKLESLPNEQ